MKHVPLAEVSLVNPRGDRMPPDQLVSFVGMAELNAESATAIPRGDEVFSEVSKGYTLFRDGDILAAKITPCWENGKVGQAKLDRPHGAGSTEFHVVRPTEALDTRYLLHFLRQDTVRLSGALRMVGSGGQRRVPQAFLERLSVPLPSLEEQRRIAAILDQADAIRAKRREVLAHLDSLTQSIFHDMFGHSAQAGELTTLGKVATFFGGASLPIGEHYDGQPHGTLLMKVSDMNSVGNEAGIAATKLWTSLPTATAATAPAGTVVIPKRGASISTNKKRIITRQTALDPNLMGVLPDPSRVMTTYLHQWFNNFDLTSITSGSSVPQLNMQDLTPLKISVPRLDRQRMLDDRLTEVEARSRKIRHAIEVDDELFASLQARAFRGEL